MLVEDRLEEYVTFAKFCLSSLSDFNADLAPHVSDENDVLEGTFATKLPEHTEIASGNPAHPKVADTVYVYHPRELYSVFVSVTYTEDQLFRPFIIELCQLAW
jgi:hypothetical protein